MRGWLYERFLRRFRKPTPAISKATISTWLAEEKVISWQERLEKVISQVEEVSQTLSPEDGIKVRLALAVYDKPQVKTSCGRDICPPTNDCRVCR